jgi:hypothetical protein
MHGILAKTVNGRWIDAAFRANKLRDVAVDRDCGKWCSAFTYLSPDLPLALFTPGHIGVGLVFDANPEVWQHVQCTSVIDSNSANRACCACNEAQFCPFPDFDGSDSGYCAAACAPGQPDRELCMQLAAGCSINTMTARFEFQCSEEEIRTGQCHLCQRPQWCDDPDSAGVAFGVVDTTDKWMHFFFGTGYPATRQCKYKRTQKDSFVATAREYNRRRQIQTDHEIAIENEVNFYVGPDDGGAEAALMDNLLGLVYLRTSGNGGDPSILSNLRRHLRRLGMRHLPIYAITNEKEGENGWWKHNVSVDVRQAPYSLDVLEV